MYEKTIACEQRSYAIVIPNTPTLVYNLLGTNDKAEYDSILNTGLTVEPLIYGAYNPSVNVRTPVDGYITSYSSSFNVRLASSGVDETILANSLYTCPVYFWPHKTWVSAATNTNAIIRIFFS